MPPLIIGGGPAGCAAALTLANAGLRPTILERQRETGDAICGGFLSWRSLATLERIGVDRASLGAMVRRTRIFAGDRFAETLLPQPGVGVSRHRLDTILLRAAARAGAGIERGVTVRSVDGDVRLDDGTILAPTATLLASGKHDVRGRARPAAARGRDPTLGLRVRARGERVEQLVGDAIELHCFDRGYAGVVVQEDGSANICLAVHRSRLAEAGSPVALLTALGQESPALGERLSFANLEAVDAIANVPYGWRARTGEHGLFRLGDQAAVIPSLAGEGMGIALASGISAANALRRDGPDGAVAWQDRFARRTRRPVAIADLTRRVMEAPRAASAAVPIVRAAPQILRLIANATRIGAAMR